MRTIKLQVALAGIILYAAVTQIGWSQTADLSGIIKDKSGGVIRNAVVSVLNENTGITRNTASSERGIYLIPLLNPGIYRVSVSAPGFQPVVRTGVVLNVGDRAALDFVLDVGKISAAVTVTAESAPLLRTSAAVATVVNRHFVENLPLNGRSFQSLILLTPGVTVASMGNNDFGQFSVNGQRGNTNYFTVDGVSANMAISTLTYGAQGGALAGAYPSLSAMGGTNSLVSVDALEEYRITTSSYAAEYGRQPGGQISLVTRAGSSKYHGTLFDYFRNDALDARDYFNKKPAPMPALRQNNFGGTFSGPIIRDKTFFFFSYEGQRLRLPTSGVYYVPSLRVRSASAPAVRTVLNAIPQPTGPELLDAAGLASGWASSEYSVSSPSSLDATSIRIDHTVGSKLSLFGRFNESPSNATTFLASTPTYGTVRETSTRTLTLGATASLAPRVINELRFNYSRSFGSGEYLQNSVNGAVPVDPKALVYKESGLGAVLFLYGGRSSIVYGGRDAQNYQRQINIIDNLSLVKGAHQIKLGVDYRQLNPTLAPGGLLAVYFQSEAAISSGIANLVFISNYPTVRPRFVNMGAYVQDSWKATPKLTMDMGLRWDLNPAPTSAKEMMPAIAVGITGNPPDVTKATLAPPGTPLYRTFYRSFAPRFGAAYQLSSKSGRETVLRGGFGVFYDLGSSATPTAFVQSANVNRLSVPYPLSAADSTRAPIVWPTSLPVTLSLTSSDVNLKMPYTLQWNVALEQSIGPQQSLSLSYVASAARRLLTTQVINYPLGFTTGPRPNPNFSTILFSWNGPTADYHSMQVQYKGGFTRDLQALLNYTWSHAIDMVSSDIGTNDLQRGNASFDVRHNFSAAITYNVRSPSALAGIRHVFRDLFMNCIVHAQTGRPLNIVGTSTPVIADGMYLRAVPDVVPGQPFYIEDKSVPGGRRFNAAAFKEAPRDPQYPNRFLRQGTLGRNVLRELPIWQIDFSMGRNIRLAESARLQLKGELFNLFNHPMYGNYNVNPLVPSTFGVPTTTLRYALSAAATGVGLSPLYQMGGPRSVQLSIRIGF